MAAAKLPSRKKRKPATSKSGKSRPVKAVKIEEGDLEIDETAEGSTDEPEPEWDPSSESRIKLENDEDDVDENFGETRTKAKKSKLSARKLKGLLAGKFITQAPYTVPI